MAAESIIDEAYKRRDNQHTWRRSRQQGSGVVIGKIAHQETTVVCIADVRRIVSVVCGAAVIADSECGCC